ncbi:MAG TPA: ABC transporter permease [Rhodothermales bacterium]|nr:ABC transporter permease [Rhodothermales bacterium]
MLKNYFKIALRNLLRHKGYTFINVAGLAVGIACCLLIFLYVRDELRYDRFNEKADRIYRVIVRSETESDGEMKDLAVTPPGLAPTLLREFPEVQRAIRLFDMSETLVKRGDRQFTERRIFLADPSIFDVFSIRLSEGDPETALAAPRCIVLSESMARKYFGNTEPLGQTLDVNNGGDFKVTGVFKDLPEQSHLKIDFLGSFATLKEFVSEARLQNWRWHQFYTYVLLPEGYDPARLEAKLPAFAERYSAPEMSEIGIRDGFNLQPLTAIHLHSTHLQFEVAEAGDIAHLYAFTAVAVFLLVIACFNFMNLATAQSMQRAKEVGMRKVVGAGRHQLMTQFLGESVLLSLLALLIAAVLVELALPSFNAFAGKSLEIGYTENAGWIAGLIGLGVFIGILAGSYPAFFLSGFRPVQVLKGMSNTGGHSLTTLRKVLVTIQFAISVVLIIGTGVAAAQLRFVQNKNLGFNKEQIVVLPLRGGVANNLEAVQAELQRNPLIVSSAGSWGVPGGIVAGDGIHLPGSKSETAINMFVVDYDYLRTYGMKIVAGRGFSREHPSDTEHAFILNETAARSFGWTPQEALGKPIEWDKWGQIEASADSIKRGEVIGVVQDFHFRSLHQAIEPLVIHIYPPAFGNLSVRIRPENAPDALDFMKQVWARWSPDWPFQYTFLDQDFARMYEADRKVGQIFSVFAGLAIFIACMGLFGLSSFAAERRTKEIGVRKVLGASVSGIVVMLSSDFLKLIAVGFVVAAPIGYLVMQRWLNDFAYHVDIGPGYFIAAALATFAIAILTVSYRSIRAALADPVKSLRYE